MIASILAFAWTTIQLGDRTTVLAIVRPVAAGQPLAAPDLKEVLAAETPQLQLITATRTADVLGRTPAVPLLPDTMLTEALLGEPRFPPPGRTVASVALKDGQFPQRLRSGSPVTVFLTANTLPTGDALPACKPTTLPSTLDAVVLQAETAADAQAGTVVTLLLDERDASLLAAAPPTGLVLMLRAPGGD